MSGRSRSYKDGLYRRLKNNAEAVNYLQAALEDSQPAFLVALKNVLEARNVAAVARASELDRAHIYRMLSEGGNPTLNSLERILHALGLKLAVDLEEAIPAEPVAVAKQTFHMSWKICEIPRRKFALYAPIAGSVGRRSLTPESEIVECVQTLAASGAVYGSEMPHLAFISECEDVFEMAY